MGGDRANKKIRLINDIPPIQNGVVSASNTPTIDEGRVVDIQVDEVSDMSLFFNKEGEERIEIPEYNVASFVKTALKSTWASEDALRNAIYTELHDNHGIPFPQSSQTSGSGIGKMLRRAVKRKSKQYIESDLSSLLVEWSKENGYQDVKRMRRIVRGLPITTTSMPDLAPLDRRGSEVQIHMGEFKNHSNYTVSIARTQCIMYLLGLLYWLRVELGKPVETVHGFFFCGVRCENQDKTYTVGLIRLSAPQSLGEEIRAQYLVETECVDNMHPLRVLIHFLKEGKRWSTADRPSLDQSCRIPSLLTLPACLWKNSDERKLVLHGTLSVVFRISGRSLQTLLSDQSPHFKEFRENKDWREFYDAVTFLLNTIDGGNTAYILKIRSKDTCLQDRPMGGMCDVWDILVGHHSSETPGQWIARDSLSKTYPVMPCVTQSFGIILMRDRGRPLKDVPTFSEGKSIIGEFHKVIQVATFLNDCLPHGDILPHNLVFDDETGELTLIDVDEGVRKARRGAMDHLLQRCNVYNGDDNDWYIALSYPNAIRDNAQSYTQSQLIASFLFVMGKINNLSDNTLKDIEGLQNHAKDLGEELCKLDKANKLLTSGNKKRMTIKVNEVYIVMTKVVNEIIAD